MQPYILVILGGGLGSLCRFLLSERMIHESSWPWPTFMANIIGSLLIGFLWAYASSETNEVFKKWVLYFGAIGFCGGFTTFSTFTKELYQYLEQEQWVLFISYAVGALVVGIVAFALTYILGLRLFS